MKKTKSQVLLYFLLLMGLCSGTLAQSKLEPVPENIRAAIQPDSPVELTIDGLYPAIGNFRQFAYTVRNRGTKEIRNINLINKRETVERPFTLGLPATLVNQLGYEAGLKPGVSRTFSHPVNDYEVKSTASLLSVDFVVFNDGAIWGADSIGQSEWLLGLYDGLARFVSSANELVAAKKDDDLKALIMRDGPEPGSPDPAKWTKRDQGMASAYSVARLALRSDILGRGDLSGVPARILDLKRQIELGPSMTDGRKQVTIQYGFGSPLKFQGLVSSGQDVAFDQRFTAAGDWLTGLKLKLRNDAGKPLKAVSFTVFFPEMVNGGRPLADGLRYGSHPVTFAEKSGQPRVPPGQSFEIVINQDNPGEMMRAISKGYDFNKISRILVDISYVEYEDGTRWNGGQWTRQDPENPRRWIPIPK